MRRLLRLPELIEMLADHPEIVGRMIDELGAARTLEALLVLKRKIEHDYHPDEIELSDRRRP
jgi:hypothetical protein